MTDVWMGWGLHGARALAGMADVVVVVDVLSFSTCVDVACARGAFIVACAPDDVPRRVDRVAVSRTAVTQAEPYSLSPASLRDIEAGTRLALPSPNGSAITAACGGIYAQVFAGCLRNATAVAQATRGRVAVIAAGERWPDRSLRPAVEDLIGAGAVINALEGVRSVDAEIAEAAFVHARGDLARSLHECESGRELIDLGFAEDVELASELNVSRCVPRLRDGAFAAD
ncbi:MAG: 2-phosphosulfolactate phosphatase [Chloroflexi bacterium]|nr:2-phosphosulfolactate phosphatase [Chloroflexota bacterium]